MAFDLLKLTGSGKDSKVLIVATAFAGFGTGTLIHTFSTVPSTKHTMILWAKALSTSANDVDIAIRGDDGSTIFIEETFTIDKYVKKDSDKALLLIPEIIFHGDATPMSLYATASDASAVYLFAGIKEKS